MVGSRRGFLGANTRPGTSITSSTKRRDVRVRIPARRFRLNRTAARRSGSPNPHHRCRTDRMGLHHDDTGLWGHARCRFDRGVDGHVRDAATGTNDRPCREAMERLCPGRRRRLVHPSLRTSRRHSRVLTFNRLKMCPRIAGRSEAQRVCRRLPSCWQGQFGT